MKANYCVRRGVGMEKQIGVPVEILSGAPSESERAHGAVTPYFNLRIIRTKKMPTGCCHR
jgi:hypothetical protein